MIYRLTDLIHIHSDIRFVADRNINLVDNGFFAFGSVAPAFSSSTFAALLVWTSSTFLKTGYFSPGFNIIFETLQFSDFIFMFLLERFIHTYSWRFINCGFFAD